MSAERWQRIHEIFEATLARPEEARSAFLESACAGEIELREEVRSLLAAYERSAEAASLPTAWLGALGAPEAPVFGAGERIAGRYLIRQLLGRGGMGEVYEAWDEELSIPVALKTLHLAGDSEETHKRLKLEGLLARSVWHPNVCRLYDLGRHGEGRGAAWFLTMELLRGETLSRRLKDRGRFPLDRALRIAEQMAAGLGAAHRAGVVHRDFKTGNVMLVAAEGGEQAVVTDFGIARAASPKAAEEDRERGFTALVGTPAYMAPEQVRGEDIGPAADIYALGVVLHEMVTGRLPFGEDARRGDATASPRSVGPEPDERWEKVIRRCLEHEPARRFRRAEDVADVLAGRRPAERDEGFAPASWARHTLPAERDDFVGREGELEELARNLAGSRVVTLVGTGGMGKTRLAVRHGWRSLGQWPGGVWFCDLTEARDVDGVASAVAQALGVQLGRGDPLEQLGHAIAGRDRCLVILDNFEQVAGHAAATVGRWLERAGATRFLVTSRERLGLGECERTQAVEPLSAEAGFDLFAARAQWLRPGLELVGEEAASAREIVRLVDGMPLAIELAAARMRVMGAAQIVQQMRRRFQLLTGGPSARHETLAAAIDGSWELLRPWEKAAWAQCSVFEGGFTLEAADAVLDLKEWPEAPPTVDVVRSLVERSLLRASMPEAWSRAGGSEARFGMYVSLQDYARMRLRERAGEPATEARHGAWYARYGGDEAIIALDRRGGVERRRELEREISNVMAACRRALGRGDGATVAAAYRASWPVLGVRGPLRAAVDLGTEALREPRLGPEPRAGVLATLATAERYAGHLTEACSHFESALTACRQAGDRLAECGLLDNLSVLLREQGRHREARECAEAELAISREIGARHTEATALNVLAGQDRHEGRMEEARAHWEAALAIHRDLGNRRLEGVVLGNLGILHYDHGRLDEARAHLEAALAIHREVGNRNSEAIALGNLGNLHQDQGRLEEARVCYEAALALHREVGHRRFEGVTLGDLGGLFLALGRPEEARSHLESALVVHGEVGNRNSEGIALGSLGALHEQEGRAEDARACYQSALAIHRKMGDPRLEGVALRRLGSLSLQEGRIEDARGALAASEAILRQVDDALEIGKLLCARAGLELDEGDPRAARASLREARALADRTRSGPGSELGRMIAKLLPRAGA